jgi:hypothetical protein
MEFSALACIHVISKRKSYPKVLATHKEIYTSSTNFPCFAMNIYPAYKRRLIVSPLCMSRPSCAELEAELERLQKEEMARGALMLSRTQVAEPEQQYPLSGESFCIGRQNPSALYLPLEE